MFKSLFKNKDGTQVIYTLEEIKEQLPNRLLKIMYKCRICNEILYEDKTRAEQSFLTFLNKIKSDIFKLSWKKLHDCGDGEFGIADIVGYKTMGEFKNDKNLEIDYFGIIKNYEE